MATSLIGCRIGQYQVVAELGRGQHSVVYKAWQPSLERYVALKVLHRYDQGTLHEFQAEANLTADLIEQGVINIRHVYDVGQTADGYLFCDPGIRGGLPLQVPARDGPRRGIGA